MKKTLNIGAGERTYETYPTPNYACTNVDTRELPGIDKVCDVRELTFEDEEFDFILASDIVEHFPIAQVQNLLKGWVRVLKPGGIVEFRLPNLAAICRQYFDGRGDARNVSWLLYGGQDYPGNFHYVGYDRRLLMEECNKAGLQEMTYDEEGFNMLVRYRKLEERV